MFFQIIDNCHFYSDGDIIKASEIPANLTHTWHYSERLKNRKDVQYAYLYSKGKQIGDVCPEEFKKEWSRIYNKLQTFKKSFKLAKVLINDDTLVGLVPNAFLLEYCQICEKITKYAFETYKKPHDYDFLLDLSILINDISKQRLNIRQDAPNQLPEAFSKTKPQVCYEIFKSVTGRLGSKKGSFPIMRFDKKHRHALKPQNDAFVELDFNSAEARVLFSLLGKEQPKEDIHAWNAKNVFNDILRDESKQRFFAWLYDEKKVDLTLGQVYSKELVLEKYWNGNKVVNPFGIEIEANKHYAVNYLMQSTAASIFLRQSIKLHNFLEGKKTFITALMHDSVLLDVAKEEKDFILTLANIYANTDLGVYRVNIKIGKDFGNMRQI